MFLFVCFKSVNWEIIILSSWWLGKLNKVTYVKHLTQCIVYKCYFFFSICRVLCVCFFFFCSSKTFAKCEELQDLWLVWSIHGFLLYILLGHTEQNLFSLFVNILWMIDDELFLCLWEWRHYSPFPCFFPLGMIIIIFAITWGCNILVKSTRKKKGIVLLVINFRDTMMWCIAADSRWVKNLCFLFISVMYGCAHSFL